MLNRKGFNMVDWFLDNMLFIIGLVIYVFFIVVSDSINVVEMMCVIYCGVGGDIVVIFLLGVIVIFVNVVVGVFLFICVICVLVIGIIVNGFIGLV